MVMAAVSVKQKFLVNLKFPNNKRLFKKTDNILKVKKESEVFNEAN